MSLWTTSPRLAPRELEVLYWASQGKTYGETAIILGISRCTVHTYTTTIRAKLGATNLTQCVAKAYELGLLP